MLHSVVRLGVDDSCVLPPPRRHSASRTLCLTSIAVAWDASASHRSPCCDVACRSSATPHAPAGPVLRRGVGVDQIVTRLHLVCIGSTVRAQRPLARSGSDRAAGGVSRPLRVPLCVQRTATLVGSCWVGELSLWCLGYMSISASAPVGGGLSSGLATWVYMARGRLLLWTVRIGSDAPSVALLLRPRSPPSRARRLSRRLPFVARGACGRGILARHDLSSYVGFGLRRLAPAAPYIDVPHACVLRRTLPAGVESGGHLMRRGRALTGLAYAFVDGPGSPRARPMSCRFWACGPAHALGRRSRRAHAVVLPRTRRRPAAALHAVTGSVAVSGRRLRRRPSLPSSLIHGLAGSRRPVAVPCAGYFVPAHPPLTGSVLGLMWSRCRMHA